MSQTNRNNPLGALRVALCRTMIERANEIQAILLGLISRAHVLLVGPPGTGKSMLCRAVAAGIEGARFCERLLSPTSPPESIFGPVSLAALREDRYEHVGEGSVTDAEIVFLDEFFRGSDAIRDTLLHLLGPERQALVGTRMVRAPLMTAVGASNSWADSADQAAILDRWLIRREIRPLSPAGLRGLLRSSPAPVTPVVTLADITDAQARADSMPISDSAWTALYEILEQLQGEGIRPSDRRCKASVAVARASAVLAGADQVEPFHLECLADVLWDVPGEQSEKAADIVSRIANPAGARVAEILRAVDEIVQGATKLRDVGEKLTAANKLETTEKELAEMLRAGQGNGRVKATLAHVKRERVRISASALKIDPEKAAALFGFDEGSEDE